MIFNKADFIASYGISSQLPESDRPELSFSGRSNVGKSSLINKLCSRKNLARVSSTPGKTATINFYAVDDCYFVDLPGYGYAKVPIPLKQHWQRHLEAYLGGRECLRGVILMMDVRHPMTDFDKMMLDWAKASRMPMHILLTKADKLTHGAGKNTLLKVQSEIRKGWGDGVTIQLFSAPKRLGVEDAYRVLAGWMELEDKPVA